MPPPLPTPTNCKLQSDIHPKVPGLSAPFKSVPTGLTRPGPATRATVAAAQAFGCSRARERALWRGVGTRQGGCRHGPWWRHSPSSLPTQHDPCLHHQWFSPFQPPHMSPLRKTAWDPQPGRAPTCIPPPARTPRGRRACEEGGGDRSLWAAWAGATALV